MSSDAPVAVVTGAGQGIGSAVCETLARDGFQIVAVDRHHDRANAVANALGLRATPVTADVSNEAAVAQMARTVIDRFGRWDVLVNNVGKLALGTIESLDLATWDSVFAGCVRTAWLCTRAATPFMRRQGRGRIVNLSSVVAQGADSSGLVAYTSAKAAVVGFTIAAARELGPAGITVNAVSPGTIETESWSKFPDPEALRAARSAVTVVGRVGQTAEVAAAVAYLVSPAAAFVTGHVLVIDGGRIDKL